MDTARLREWVVVTRTCSAGDNTRYAELQTVDDRTFMCVRIHQPEATGDATVFAGAQELVFPPTSDPIYVAGRVRGDGHVQWLPEWDPQFSALRREILLHLPAGRGKRHVAGGPAEPEPARPKPAEMQTLWHALQQCGATVAEACNAREFEKANWLSVHFEGTHGTNKIVHLMQVDPRIGMLVFKACDLSDAGIAQLAEFDRLTRLELRATEVTSDGVAALSHCDSLAHLGLFDMALTPTALAAVASIRSLTELSIERCPADPQALCVLEQLANLEDLQLVDVAVSPDFMLQTVPRLQRLGTLALINAGIRDGSKLAALPRCPKLEEVWLPRSRISGEGIGHLAACSGLRDLRLGWTDVADTDIAMLADLQYLQTLDLEHTRVTDVGMDELAKSAPRLECLFLGGTAVTSESCNLLMKAFPHLSMVGLSNTSVPASDIAKLETTRPDLIVDA